MPNIERQPVIRDVYNKTSGSGTNSVAYGFPFGIESCYSKLTTKAETTLNSAALTSINHSDPIYEDNVQAELERKGYQINDLKNTAEQTNQNLQQINNNISNLTAATSNYITMNMVDGTPSTETNGNKVLTQSSSIQIQDNKVNLLQDTREAIQTGTKVDQISQIPTLHEAIPYMVQANYTQPNSTITAYNGPSSTTYDENNNAISPLILGKDGLYNIGRKFNALTNRVQNLEHSFMSDDELINRYYTQGQHYCIYNSNIQSELGYPHIDSTTNRIVPNGHMRYLVYEGTVSSTAAVGPTESRPKNCKTIYYKNKNTTTTYAYSIYRGKLLGETYTVNSPYTLYDKEYLPTPPTGYRWRCVYVRGTNPTPTQTESATGENQLWQILDGYHTYTGYISGTKKALSADLNIPNLYKGTNYNNLGGIITQGGKTFSRVATQKPNQWKSLLVCTDQNEVFDTFSNASAYKGYGVLFKNLLIRGNDARVYQNNRIYGKRGKVGSAHETDSTKIEAFQKIGSKFNPEEKIRVELLTSNSTEGSSWYVTQDGTVGSLSQGAVGISLLNFPITLYYKQPFMYAEYTLVRDTGNISAEELYYWYNNTITTIGDEEDESSEG